MDTTGTTGGSGGSGGGCGDSGGTSTDIGTFLFRTFNIRVRVTFDDLDRLRKL